MSITNPTAAPKANKNKENMILFVLLCLLGILSAIVLLNNTSDEVVQQVKATAKTVANTTVANTTVAKPKPKTMLTYEDFKEEYEAKEAEALAKAERKAKAKAKAEAEALKKAKEAKALAKAKAEAKRIASINSKCWYQIRKSVLENSLDEPTKIESQMKNNKICRSISFIYPEAVDVFTYDELNISRYKYTIVKIQANKIKIIKLNIKEKKEKAKKIAKAKKIKKIKEKIKRNEEKLKEDIRKSYLKRLMLERKLKATK